MYGLYIPRALQKPGLFQPKQGLFGLHESDTGSAAKKSFALPYKSSPPNQDNLTKRGPLRLT